MPAAFRVPRPGWVDGMDAPSAGMGARLDRAGRCVRAWIYVGGAAVLGCTRWAPDVRALRSPSALSAAVCRLPARSTTHAGTDRACGTVEVKEGWFVYTHLAASGQLRAQHLGRQTPPPMPPILPRPTIPAYTTSYSRLIMMPRFPSSTLALSLPPS